MASYTFFLASSLEKVFPNRRPAAMEAGATLSAWPGTRAAVQLVYYGDFHREGDFVPEFALEVTGGPGEAVLRRVELIPSDFPCYDNADGDYITTEPGLFPDLLQPIPEARIKPLHGQYRSVWIHWDIPEDGAGEYPVTVTARGLGGGPVFENRLTMRVGRCRLPEQKLIHTEWFHADCLAQYYGVAPWSEAHWQIVENFIRTAARECGVNMLLTPVFTPPLDTRVGGERLTVQLVDVYRNGETYRFGFEKLERWADICRKWGISYLEIAHLFTQWGAEATPKILAVVDGREQRIFGWDVPASSVAYRAFLEAFLPALREALARMGFDRDHVFYHISDEPGREQLPAYRLARAQTADLLAGCRMLDALSSLEFYREGMVDRAAVASDQIGPFLEARVPGLWVYYCCAQGREVPNRFFAMESARNRIMGVLLYLHRVEGFLHWGYNFYNSQYSVHPIDPYRVTHAGYAFPSGDPFLVYPGPEGEALTSIRAEVQAEGRTDRRGLQMRESLSGRYAAEALVKDLAGESDLSFRDYPRDTGFLLKLRERLWEALEEAYRT